MTHHTHAVTDIQPGEELTISYVDLFGTRQSRQERISKAWGFSCTCTHCTMQLERVVDSDKRLSEIESIERELGDFHSSKASVKMIARMIQLCKDEKLHARMAGTYTLAAMNYNLFGNAKMARKYADLAVQAGEMEHGPGAADVAEMAALRENPRKHWTWNARRR
jgi:hypothetical protein